MTGSFPALRAVALDAMDARAVAEFYRQLLGYVYRPGDEPPPTGQRDTQGEEWLVLILDMTVANVDQLAAQRDRAVSLGATVLLDQASDPNEPLYVFGDPAGHPFCIFVSPDHPG
jgi:Glyoxalase-like domain